MVSKDFLVNFTVGLEGLCAKLKLDVSKGLTAADLPERAAHFGSNF